MRKMMIMVAALGGLLLTPVPASAGGADLSGALDARAAAARQGGITDAGAKGGAGVQASWHSGTLAKGATQAWYWNNANPLSAGFKVGFSPIGATAGKACRFETITQTYLRMPGGERKFYFVIKNDGPIACGTTILLASADGGLIGSTGGLNPGQSQTWFWNIHHHSESHPIQMLGVNPTGQTSTVPCQFEVVRSSYRSVVPGRWEFWFTIRNISSIACGADLYLGSVQKDTGWRTFTNIDPGETWRMTWNNANPLNGVYLPMADPFVLPVNTQCHLEVGRTYYSQVINSNGFAERRFELDVTNVGVHTCFDVHVSMATIAA